MVAGKMRVAMGFHKSPSRSPVPEIPPSKSPLPSGSSENRVPKKAVFSRSFGVYFPSRSSAQVQPRPPDVCELLRLVEELRERESLLKTELLELKLLKESAAFVPVLENEIAAKNAELQAKSKDILGLEGENERLREELEELRGKMKEERGESVRKLKEMEGEIEELKKTTSYKSCSFRGEAIMDCDDLSSSQRFQGLMEASGRSNLIKNMKKSTKCTDTNSLSQDNPQKFLEGADLRREEAESERPGHSSCNSDELAESNDSALPIPRSRAPRVPKPPPKPSSTSTSISPPSLSSSSSGCSDASENNPSTEQAISQPPIPPPPPLPPMVQLVPPPPPPPPPSKAIPPPPQPPLKGTKLIPAKVKRVPEVVEFYHSLMRRDSRRESNSGVPDVPVTANQRDMIGEIENRSAHLLAIKTDVETQGDFIRFLIKEVQSAAFINIEDVVQFVKWLDDELSYLVDERAVLKHFDWPEQKADALREAAFGYCDLKKLESEASCFRDNPRQSCGPALKKMQALLEKLEHGVYNLSRMRESASTRYKVFNIPTDWMLDSGYVSQIKLASVKLAMKYMKRVSAELETVGGGPEEEELIVQGVRFAFRVHQFAGGFDVDTMRAFQELRDKARSCHVQCQNQQHKFVCRPTTC